MRLKLEKIKNIFVSNIKKIHFSNSFIVFLIFNISLFVTHVLFNYFAFGDCKVPFGYNSALFWIQKIVPSIFIGSFIFITKNWWWSLLVLLLLDIWAVCNLIYFQANDLFLDINAILMADNMGGFWGSTIMFFRIKFISIFIIAAIYGIFLFYIKPDGRRRWIYTFVCLLSVLIYTPISNSIAQRWTHNDVGDHSVNSIFSPFGNFAYHAWEDNANFRTYVNFNSISQYFITMIKYQQLYNEYYKSGHIPNNMTDRDKHDVELLCKDTRDSVIIPNNNLIIILVESLESWPLNSSINGQPIMPNLSKWIKEHKTLYCSKVKSQVKHGVSGDGQMILNTGILPISSGAACRLYGENTFPNIAHFYKSSVTINPAKGMWNQKVVNVSYGIKELLESYKISNDINVRDHIIEKMNNMEEPFYIQGITIDSHSSFYRVSETDINFPDDFDYTLKRYLKCIHYVDNWLGSFLEKFEESKAFNNTTLIITGDHTVFKTQYRKEVQKCAKKYNLPIKIDESYCPLCIYSPNIGKNMVIDEICYQMDIYPTILNLIGCEDYFWNGFGADLTDSIITRKYSENRAYELSDKIIRNNYFKQ